MIMVMTDNYKIVNKHKSGKDAIVITGSYEKCQKWLINNPDYKYMKIVKSQ